MSDQITLSVEETPTGGRIVARLEGDAAAPEAEITFSLAGEGLLIADHTGVPDAFRGKGVGVIMVEKLIELVHSKSRKLIPLCPFVKAQVGKHPEWQDVVA